MTKFIFAGRPDSDTVYLYSKSGALNTPSDAEIEYQIDREDKDVRLTINDYYFDKPDLDYLIEFLETVRKEIA